MVLFAVFALMAGAGGCGGGGHNDGDNPAPTPAPGPAPEGMTTSKEAVVVGSVPDSVEFWPSLKARLTDLSVNDNSGGAGIDANAKLIFIHSGNVDDVTDADIKNAYGRGAIVTLLEPTQASLASLAAKVDHRLTALLEKDIEGYSFVSADDAVHTYVLNLETEAPPAKQPEEPVQSTVAGEESAAPGESTESRSEGSEGSEGVRASASPSAEVGEEKTIERGLDHFVEWLDNAAPKSWKSGAAKARANARLSSSADSVNDLVKAQTVSYYDTFYSLYDISGWRPNSHVTDTYTVYAVYSYDQQYDYYIIDQEIMLDNADMYKGMYDDTDYGHKDGHDMAYYLYNHYTDHYLRTSAGADLPPGLNSGQVTLIQAQPTTGVGSSSYTTSQSYTISGSIGFSGMGGTGSVSGGATYTSSRSSNMSDLQINNQGTQSAVGGSTSNARWTYQVQNLPHPDNEYTIGHPHKSTIDPNPPAIAVQTATFNNSWIWIVPTAKGSTATYQVYNRSQPNYAFCYAAASWPNFWVVDNAYGGYLIEHSFNLTPPPRN
jgi:hypothetical protein